jgi:hypothetical protein
MSPRAAVALYFSTLVVLSGTTSDALPNGDAPAVADAGGDAAAAAMDASAAAAASVLEELIDFSKAVGNLERDLTASFAEADDLRASLANGTVLTIDGAIDVAQSLQGAAATSLRVGSAGDGSDGDAADAVAADGALHTAVRDALLEHVHAQDNGDGGGGSDAGERMDAAIERFLAAAAGLEASARGDQGEGVVGTRSSSSSRARERTLEARVEQLTHDTTRLHARLLARDAECAAAAASADARLIEARYGSSATHTTTALTLGSSRRDTDHR